TRPGAKPARRCTSIRKSSANTGSRAPWINHSWHATFYVDARGLTTSLIPDGPGGAEILIDLIDHRIIGVATDGRRASFVLGAMIFAEFHSRFRDLVRALGGTPKLNGRRTRWWMRCRSPRTCGRGRTMRNPSAASFRRSYGSISS